MAILVNGNGNARVYAAQDADLIASITGNTTVRTSVGNKMAATAADASTISVADGVILTKEGRRIQLDAGQTDLFTIPTGSAGVTNYYIIGYKLTTNSDNVQIAETFVQLMASSTDTIPEGTFRGGDSEVYVSVARVEQDGVNLGTITALLPELETISELNNDLGDLSDLNTEDKSSIVNAINEVAEGSTSDFSAGIDITSYTSASKYEAPSDGYVTVSIAQTSAPNECLYCGIYNSDETTHFSITATATSNGNVVNPCFVKKGVKICKTVSIGSSARSIFFYPLS